MTRSSEVASKESTTKKWKRHDESFGQHKSNSETLKHQSKIGFLSNYTEIVILSLIEKHFRKLKLGYVLPWETDDLYLYQKIGLKGTEDIIFWIFRAWERIINVCCHFLSFLSVPASHSCVNNVGMFRDADFDLCERTTNDRRSKMQKKRMPPLNEQKCSWKGKQNLFLVVSLGGELLGLNFKRQKQE